MALISPDKTVPTDRVKFRLAGLGERAKGGYKVQTPLTRDFDDKIQIDVDDVGIVLVAATSLDEFEGYVILFEKAGLCWVEWYKIIPNA